MPASLTQYAICPLALAVLLACGMTSSSAAALPKAGTSVSDTGVLVAAKPGALLVETKKYGKVVVKIPDNGRQVVTVKGNLTVDQLKAGMFGRIFGKLKGTQVEDEVNELVLFSPADGYQLGVFSNDPEQPATINGRLEKITERTLTLNAGKKLQATLAEKAVIRVDTNDYSLTGPGNKVSLNGRVAADGTITPKTVVITVGDEPKKAEPKKK